MNIAVYPKITAGIFSNDFTNVEKFFIILQKNVRISYFIWNMFDFNIVLVKYCSQTTAFFIKNPN